MYSYLHRYTEIDLTHFKTFYFRGVPMFETLLYSLIGAIISVAALRKFAYRQTNQEEFKIDVVLVIILTIVYAMLLNSMFAPKNIIVSPNTTPQKSPVQQ